MAMGSHVRGVVSKIQGRNLWNVKPDSCACARGREHKMLAFEHDPPRCSANQLLQIHGRGTGSLYKNRRIDLLPESTFLG
jgi:hypothetical protein